MGLTFLDSHSTAVESLLGQVPDNAVERTRALRFQDRKFVPCINGFTHWEKDVPVMKLARDDVSIVRMMVPGSAWGPNIEDSLLMLFALLHACSGLYNVVQGYLILGRGRRGEKLLAEAFQFLKDYPIVKDWWERKFPSLPAADIERARNKLRYLLIDFPFRFMFVQTTDRYNVREIVDNDEHLLVDAPTGHLSSGVAEFGYRLILRRHHPVAMARAGTDPATWTERVVVIDEAQYATCSLFGLSDILREWRKVLFCVILAVQTRHMLSEADARSLGDIGNLVAFGCSPDESEHVAKDFRGEVDKRDLVHRRVGEAYALLGNEVMSLKTAPPPERTSRERAREIIERSRREYCIPIKEAREIEREVWEDDRPKPRRGLGQYDPW